MQFCAKWSLQMIAQNANFLRKHVAQRKQKFLLSFQKLCKSFANGNPIQSLPLIFTSSYYASIFTTFHCLILLLSRPRLINFWLQLKPYLATSKYYWILNVSTIKVIKAFAFYFKDYINIKQILIIPTLISRLINSCSGSSWSASSLCSLQCNMF